EPKQTGPGRIAASIEIAPAAPLLGGSNTINPAPSSPSCREAPCTVVHITLTFVTPFRATFRLAYAAVRSSASTATTESKLLAIGIVNSPTPAYRSIATDPPSRPTTSRTNGDRIVEFD